MGDYIEGMEQWHVTGNHQINSRHIVKGSEEKTKKVQVRDVEC
jgi:hypothetical protein